MFFNWFININIIVIVIDNKVVFVMFNVKFNFVVNIISKVVNNRIV